MIAAIAILFAAALPQDPSAPEEERKARADLAHAAHHLDELLLRADQVRDRARAAMVLTRTTEVTASQVDRARLAKLAADLTAQLSSLEASIDAHVPNIRALRAAINAEIPPPAEGSIPWFRERMDAARKLATHEETMAALRAIESELQVERVKAKPGAAALLGHVRYLLAEALRGIATQAQTRNRLSEAVDRMRDAAKKLEQVLLAPDSADTGEASSLHAAALRRRVEIEASIYLGYRAMNQSSHDATARRHRKNAEDAFEQLKKVHGDATLSDGQRVVDAVRASVQSMR